MFSRYKPLCAAIFSGLLLTLAFSSCEKKITPDPAPVVDAILTEQKLIRKWEVQSYKLYDYTNDTLKHIYTFTRVIGGEQDGQLVGNDPWVIALHTTYITFNAAHSFFHTDIDGNPDGYMLYEFLPDQGGTWSFKDAKTINLTTKSLIDGHIEQQDWEVLDYNGYALLIGTTDSTVAMGDRKKTLCTIEFIPKQ
jgi:hypothetical protein